MSQIKLPTLIPKSIRSVGSLLLIYSIPVSSWDLPFDVSEFRREVEGDTGLLDIFSNLPINCEGKLVNKKWFLGVQNDEFVFRADWEIPGGVFPPKIKPRRTIIFEKSVYCFDQSE